MLVYVARHAWAGHYGDPAWPDDSQRPLTDEGVERYRHVIAGLVERGFAPQHLATSPYVRCLQTAELIAAGVPTAPKIEVLEDLAPGSRLLPLLEWSAAKGVKSVCWVGHNPDVERIVAELVGDGFASIRFAKGSVAAVQFENGSPEPSEGTLLWHATAKLLGV